MEDLRALVIDAQAGDLSAFEAIVQQLQDLAVGYAYSILGDFHLAEDAAQEAFISAFLNLHQLCEPVALSNWFRSVVFKHCDRLTRRKRLETILPEAAMNLPDNSHTPLESLEAQETKSIGLQAIDALSKKQCQAVTLFYISGYSQKEIAGFLNVSATHSQQPASIRTETARNTSQSRSCRGKDDNNGQKNAFPGGPVSR